jgi:hypothetical protein
VLYPKDPLIAYTLGALGFAHVTSMTPGQPMLAEHAELANVAA